jgi:hypothetical protein
VRASADESIPDLVLKHPRIFEYKLESQDASYLVKGRARIQVRSSKGCQGQQAVWSAAEGRKDRSRVQDHQSSWVLLSST